MTNRSVPCGNPVHGGAGGASAAPLLASDQEPDDEPDESNRASENSSSTTSSPSSCVPVDETSAKSRRTVRLTVPLMTVYTVCTSCEGPGSATSGQSRMQVGSVPDQFPPPAHITDELAPEYPGAHVSVHTVPQQSCGAVQLLTTPTIGGNLLQTPHPSPHPRHTGSCPSHTPDDVHRRCISPVSANPASQAYVARLG